MEKLLMNVKNLEELSTTSNKSMTYRLLPYLHQIETLRSEGVSLKRIAEQLQIDPQQLYVSLPRAIKLAEKNKQRKGNRSDLSRSITEDSNIKSTKNDEKDEKKKPNREEIRKLFKPSNHIDSFNLELKHT